MAASSGDISHGFTKIPRYSWRPCQEQNITKPTRIAEIGDTLNYTATLRHHNASLHAEQSSAALESVLWGTNVQLGIQGRACRDTNNIGTWIHLRWEPAFWQ